MNTIANNYTFQDLIGILRALPFFIPVLMAPGYLIGMAANVLEFRMRGASERILLSLVLSCAVSPFAINLLCRFFPVPAVSLAFLLLGAIFAAVVLTEWSRSGFKVRMQMHWTTKTALCLVGAWAVICLASLPDLQIGTSIYSTAAIWDHSVRSAFIASAVRTGAPPANPFFYPGHPVNARYYYYWNVLCALPTYLSGASARNVLGASCLWSGLCLASTIPVSLKHFLERNSNLRPTTVLGIGLLAVTGLDLIPTFAIALFHTTPPYADMEWWDAEQVASWIASLIWVPHHVASLVAFLTGFLLLWKGNATTLTSQRILLVTLAAVGFSSAAGLSVYVTFTFALFAAGWVIYLLGRGKIASAMLYSSAGLLALLMSSAYLSDLRGHGTANGTGAISFFTFQLRDLPSLFGPFVDILGSRSVIVAALLYLLFLVLTFYLELGVYFAVAIFQIKSDWKHRRELSECQKCLWLMVSTSLVVMLFLRSNVIGSNDLAWRGALVLQFVLLLWTAALFADRLRSRQGNTLGAWCSWIGVNKAMFALILLGGASSLYQLAMLRTYTLFRDRYDWNNKLLMASGAEAFLIRRGLDALARVNPPDTVLQYNPKSPVAIHLEAYSQYQSADAFGPGCQTVFGGSPADCPSIEAQLNRIFAPLPGQDMNFLEVVKVCRSLKIDDLLVTARDPIWNQSKSWAWQARPSIKNDFIRVYSCGIHP